MKEQTESKELTLNEYQEKAMNTCMPSCNNFSYMMLNLVGEVGELASKIAKSIRKEQMYIGTNEEKEDSHLMITQKLISEDHQGKFDNDLMLEAGDILWQLAGLCHVMGWKLGDVGQSNIDKLASRKKRGTIDGNGDHR